MSDFGTHLWKMLASLELDRRPVFDATHSNPIKRSEGAVGGEGLLLETSDGMDATERQLARGVKLVCSNQARERQAKGEAESPNPSPEPLPCRERIPNLNPDY